MPLPHRRWTQWPRPLVVEQLQHRAMDDRARWIPTTVAATTLVLVPPTILVGYPRHHPARHPRHRHPHRDLALHRQARTGFQRHLRCLASATHNNNNSPCQRHPMDIIRNSNSSRTCPEILHSSNRPCPEQRMEEEALLSSSSNPPWAEAFRSSNLPWAEAFHSSRHSQCSQAHHRNGHLRHLPTTNKILLANPLINQSINA